MSTNPKAPVILNASEGSVATEMRSFATLRFAQDDKPFLELLLEP